jgi:hypothetical protein
MEATMQDQHSHARKKDAETIKDLQLKIAQHGHATAHYKATAEVLAATVQTLEAANQVLTAELKQVNATAKENFQLYAAVSLRVDGAESQSRQDQAAAASARQEAREALAAAAAAEAARQACQKRVSDLEEACTS